MNIEELRQISLSLPHATEDVKWEKDLCFCIAEKMFCVTGLIPGHDKASFKTDKEEFEKLIERPGIIPAPYLARHSWVLADYESLTDLEWDHYIRLSYQLVREKLPAKIRKNLDEIP